MQSGYCAVVRLQKVATCYCLVGYLLLTTLSSATLDHSSVIVNQSSLAVIESRDPTCVVGMEIELRWSGWVERVCGTGEWSGWVERGG